MLQQKCTSIGVNKTDEAPTYVAQNINPPDFLQGFPTLLHIKDHKSDLESYVFTFPGFIGLNGLNNKTIAVTANGLPDFSNERDGLPVSFVVRGILAQTELDHAISFILEIKHAKAQNYIIGGKNEALCFECFANEINQFVPLENAGLSYHTNHYLVNASGNQYCSRLETLKEEIRKRNYKIKFDDIKSILSSRRRNTGRPISNVWTYGCTIMVLSDRPGLHIAPGRQDISEFIRFDFN